MERRPGLRKILCPALCVYMSYVIGNFDAVSFYRSVFLAQVKEEERFSAPKHVYIRTPGKVLERRLE
jgi:hypothetical protein